MPRKLSDVKEDEIEPLPDQSVPGPDTDHPGDSQEPSQAIVPAAQSLEYIDDPENDPIVAYVSGTPVYQTEATAFGTSFIKLLEMMTRMTGIDDSPEPQGKTPNYLRVTCPHCSQVTVTVAPHVERYCSGCGGHLPSPSYQEPAKRTSFKDELINDGVDVIDVEGGN